MLIGELVAAIRADTSHLKKGLNEATNDIKNFSSKSTKSFSALESTIGSLKRQILSLVGIYGMQRLARSFVDAASTTEQFQIRLKFLLRSAEAANQTFKDMSEYAARVPHTYQSVLEAATRLSGVMKGGSEEINRWMPLIGDLAAATGHSLQITLGQIIRMYSAGASAADLFREHGILSMLGFQYGVRYTAEETRRILFDSWTRIDSQFRGAADELGKTWAGLMSMMSDRWFQFRNLLMNQGTFDLIKSYLDDIIVRIDKMTETGELKKFAESLGNTIVKALKLLENSITIIYNNWSKLRYLVGLFIAMKLGAYFTQMATNAGLAIIGIKGMTGAFVAFKATATGGWLVGVATALGGIATAGGLVAGAMYGAKKASDAYNESMKKWTITMPGYVPGKQSPLPDLLLKGMEDFVWEIPVERIHFAPAGSHLAGVPFPRTGMTAMSGLGMSPTFGLGASKSTVDLKAARETYKLWLETDKLAAKVYIETPEKGLDSLADYWKDTIAYMKMDFTEAMLGGGEDFLDGFERMFNNVITNISRKFIQENITNKLFEGIEGEWSTKKVGSGFFKGRTYGDITEGYLDLIGGALVGLGGAYNIYQGQQAGTLDPFSGGLQGAIAGAALGSIIPGIGTGIGAIGGGILGVGAGLFSRGEGKKEPEIIYEEIEIMWDIVAGQIKDVTMNIENMGYNKADEIRRSITEQMESQLTFFNTLAGIWEMEQFSFTTSLQSRLPSGSNIVGMGTPSAMMNIQDYFQNYNMFEQLFGKQAVSEIDKLLDPIYKGIILQLVLQNAAQARPISFEELMGGLDVTPQGLIGVPGSSGMAANVVQGLAWTAAESEAVNEYFQKLDEKLSGFRESLSTTVAGAFKDSLSSKDFVSFENYLKQSIYEQIVNSLSLAFGSNLVNALTKILLPSMSGIETYIGESSQVGIPGFTRSVTLEDIENELLTGLGVLSPALEDLKTSGIYDMFINSLTLVTDALGLNTNALGLNTSSIMGPVNDFLTSLDIGALASSESLVGIAGMAENLYTKALADPAQFSAYANFMTSTFLPLQQGIAPDYAGVLSGVREQVSSIPYVQEGREQERQLLLDIKEAIENNPPVVIIDGEVIGDAAKKKIEEDSEFLGQLGSTLSNMASGFKNIFS